MARVLTKIASFVSWHRRIVGGFLAAAAVLLTVQALSAPPPPTVDVAVVTSDVAAGHILTDGDVGLRGMPPDRVPADAFHSVVVGEAVATSLSAGTVLQPGLIAGATPTEEGRAVVPISVSDESLRSLLRPGDAVTLVMSAMESAEVLTNDARIATLPTQPDGGTFDISASSGSDLVLVEVPADQAAVVAALGQGGQLSVILGTV